MKLTLFTVTVAAQKDSYKGNTIFTIPMTFNKGNKPLYKVVMDIEKLTGLFVADIHKIEEIEL